MLNKLRQINQDKINKEEDLLNQQMIKILLSKDDCFFEVPMETALSILQKLGFDEKDSMEIYKELISEREYSKVKKVEL